jgi:hypothetical protein
LLAVGLLLIGQESWPDNFSDELGSGPVSVAAEEQSFAQALTLIGAGQFIPSLRLLQRAVIHSQGKPDAWRVRVVYAEALNSAAFQVIDRLGVHGPQQSISTQRIALLRQASAQLDSAERVTEDSEARAIIRYRHGHLLEVWGFPMDAYGWYCEALRADPRCGDALLGMMRTRALMGVGADTTGNH